MSEATMRDYLAENPRLIGVLFATLLVLSQAGSAAAGNGFSMVGP